MNTPTGIYTSNVYHSSIPMGDKTMVEEIDYFIPAEDTQKKTPGTVKKRSVRRKKSKKKSIRKKQKGGKRK